MKLSEQEKLIIVRECLDGTSIAKLAIHYNVSSSTIDRVLRQRRDDGEEISLRRGRPNKTSPFPYPQKLTSEERDREIARLRSNPLQLVDGEIRPRNYFGTKLCAPHFPNRYSATWKNTPSALAAWGDTALRERAIAFQIRHGDPVTPHRVLRAITLICRTPTIFRPSVARFVYARYCRPGGIAWDPCAGYGGRLLGAHVAGIHYVGTDVDEQTAQGNRELAKEIDSTAEIYTTPAETFSPPIVDLVFTSPPYFDRERYSKNTEQSWRKHGRDLDSWLAGFLAPVAERATRALRQGGHLVLNVADLKERKSVLPIVSRTVDVLRALDLVHVETLRMPLAAINKKDPTEPILIFQKP